MEKLKQQVARARRRLTLQRFLGVLPWCWFGTFLGAAAAIGVQRWYLIGIDEWRWAAWWLGGAVVVGWFAAIVWTLSARCGPFEAALEIDRRFGLKERVSSSLMLTREELESPCGQALVEDTAARISRLGIANQFPVTISRRALLPLAPAAVAIALYWLPSPTFITQANAAAERAVAEHHIKESIKPLEKTIEKRSQRAKEVGLIAVAELLKKIANEIHNLVSKDDADHHETLAKLHELTQELAGREERLAEAAKIQQYLSSLKNIPAGPAEKLAQELKNGDFEKAVAELQQLQEQLAHGQLNSQQQTAFAQQMAAMSKALQKILEQHQSTLDKLQQQLAAARQSGDRQAAQKLQEPLAKLEQQQPSMDAVKQFADQFAECAKSEQARQTSATQSALNQLAGQLAQMQQPSQEMELIEATLNDIDDAKAAMNGKQGGTEAAGRHPDRTAGSEGVGHRPGGAGIVPQRVPAQTYDSAVKSPPSGRGVEVQAGPADGPNLKGRALEQIKSQMQAAGTAAADPVTSESLPRAQRDQVQQYFDAFRSGQ